MPNTKIYKNKTRNISKLIAAWKLDWVTCSEIGKDWKKHRDSLKVQKIAILTWLDLSNSMKVDIISSKNIA